jgi:hypothetical protein
MQDKLRHLHEPLSEKIAQQSTQNVSRRCRAGDNSERSAQLMRSGCGEMALREESALEADRAPH